MPRVTLFAAVGLAALQFCAIAFHVARGEFQVVPLDIMLVLLPVFIIWGRLRLHPLSGAASDASSAPMAFR